MSTSRTGVALASLLVFAGSGWPQAPPLGLWLEPGLDLLDPVTRQRVLTAPVNKVLVPLFVNGETLHPSKSSLFPQARAYRGKADPVEQLLTEAKARGVSVWGFVECLQWTRPGTPLEEDLLDKEKGLAERNREGGCGLPAEGKYASPSHPRVRKVLRDLVEEIGTRYPGLHGIVLQCRLPLASTLGFSEASRAQYIRLKQIDPIDLLRGSGRAEAKLDVEWLAWRRDQMAALVKEISTGYKSKHPKGKVAALGYANWYRLGLGARNNSLEDWVGWAVARSVDELVLEARWDQPANQDAWTYCLALIEKTGRSIPTSVAVNLRDGEEPIPLAESRKAWAKAAPGTEWLRIGSKEDLTRVLDPAAEPPAPTPVEWKLENDPALLVKLSLQLESPTAAEVMAHLAKVTNRQFTGSSNVSAVKPALGSVHWENQAVYVAMQELATSPIIQGHWEKTADGYHLVGTVEAEESRPKSIHWLTATALLLLAAFGVWFFLLKDRRARGDRAGVKT